MADPPKVKEPIEAISRKHIVGKHLEKIPGAERDAHRVLQQNIKIPDTTMINFGPVFEPHDETKDSDGRRGSFFFFFNENYNNNPVSASVRLAHRDIIMWLGFRLVDNDSSGKFEAIFDKWWGDANAEQQVGVAVLEAMINGNGPLVLVREQATLRGIRLQDLPARGFFPVLVDGVYDHFVFFWPNRQTRTDNFGASDATRIEFEDVFFIRLNRPAGAFFGRPPAYQALNLMNEFMGLMMLMGTMGRRQTHGLLHAKVKTDGLSDDPRVDPDTGDPIMSEVEERLWQVQKLLDDMVRVDEETKATEIASALTTLEDIDIVSIKMESDLAGVATAVDTYLRVLDRSWRLPRLFQGEGESSNRATATVQQKHQASVFESWWQNVAEEMADKFLPALGIPKDMVHFERRNNLVPDDVELQTMLMDALTRAVQGGVLLNEEARAELDPLLKEVGLKDSEPPAPVSEEEVKPEDTIDQGAEEE